MSLDTNEKRWVQDFGDNRWVEFIGAFNSIAPTVTKGDMIVRSGAGGNDRLAVGRNGQVLSANSSPTLGVQWGEAVNPRYKTVFYDDYTDYVSRSYVGNTGAGATFFAGTSLGNPGQLGVTTGTTNAGGGIIGIPTQNRNINTTRRLYLEELIYLEALSTGTEEYILFVGFNDNGTTISATHPTNGAYFYYDRATNGNVWACRTMNGGASTNTVSSIAVTALSFVRLTITNTNGSIVFAVNGTTAATHTTNIPTAALSFTKSIRKKVGTTSRYLLGDYCYLTEEVSR